MNPDDVERRLSDAFTAQAYQAVNDQVPVPPLDFDRELVRHVPQRRRSIAKIIAPLAAAAAIAGIAIGVAAHQDNHHSNRISAGRSTVNVGSPTGAPTSATLPPTGLVHLAFRLSSGSQVGVGMPVIAYLSRTITDARPLQAATRVTADNKPVTAAWYFAPVAGRPGAAMQAHLRMEGYWPAHAKIVVKVAARGLAAGRGLIYDQDASLTFETGAATIATVDDSTHLMSVTEDGKPLGQFPVSLGASDTPTEHGVKVIMEKGANICLTGPGYHECNLKYTQQLTASGEYLVAAPWNAKNIAQGIDSSNGCTNLTTSDAAKLYGILEIGDVVNYPNATGAHMPFADGLGDWNVPWKTWLTGGMVATH